MDDTTADNWGAQWYETTGALPGDYNDTAKMAPFNPFPEQGSWWENIIKYGAVRAIDNTFGPVPVAGNVYPGSLAGQNGRTYTNGQRSPYLGGANGLGVAAAGGGGMSWMLIAGLAIGAVLLLRKG